MSALNTLIGSKKFPNRRSKLIAHAIALEAGYDFKAITDPTSLAALIGIDHVTGRKGLTDLIEAGIVIVEGTQIGRKALTLYRLRFDLTVLRKLPRQPRRLHEAPK